MQSVNRDLDWVATIAEKLDPPPDTPPIEIHTFDGLVIEGTLKNTLMILGREADIASLLELDIQRVNQFQLIWNDRHSGGYFDGSYYQPMVPAGYSALGHYAQGDYATPTGEIIVVKERKDGAPSQSC